MTKRKPANETTQVVKPILEWLAAQGFIVISGKKISGMDGFVYAAWVLQHLGPQRGVVWRQNTGCAPMLGAGGKVRPIRFGQPGMADIVGIIGGGRWLAIECKRGAGKLVKGSQQEAFREVIEAMGGLYILATSTEDVADGLKEAGIL